ncbi:SWI/SNF complex subunit SWI3C-like isoform X2 [Salvia divinorum]|uniref:SWI/SNF complex subunit SWI3C-like isoform X2 n=1 Tax=Salvia divinorum TaxID=28513 RepID=A0ABD1FWM1_SALDI
MTGCRGPAMPSRGFPGAIHAPAPPFLLWGNVRKWETPKTTKLTKRSFSTTRRKKKKPPIRSSPTSTESPARKARASWRKQKRDNSVARKSKLKEYDDDILDDNDDDDDPDLDPPQNHLESEDDPQICSSYGTTQITGEKEDEKLVVGGLKLCEFPLSIKREINRPHSSVFRIVEFERAARYGDSIGLGQSGVPVLENISYGQLQALSAVPRDNPALLGVPSKETASGSGGGSYVITPPRIVAGSGVTKRLGSACHFHVVRVHSGPSIDNEDLTRIVRFLDHWGIINYCATPPKHEAPKDGTYLCEDLNNELCIPLSALKSIDSLIKFDKPKCRLKATDVYPELACQQEEDSDIDSAIREKLSKHQCNYCSRPIPAECYQPQKERHPLGPITPSSGEEGSRLTLQGPREISPPPASGVAAGHTLPSAEVAVVAPSSRRFSTALAATPTVQALSPFRGPAAAVLLLDAHRTIVVARFS